MLLTLDSTRAGCLLMTGSTTPFHQQPVHVREQIIQGWSNSYLPPLRTVAKAFTFVFKSFWVKTSPSLRQVLDYPLAPAHGTPGKGYDYEFIQFKAGDEPETIETDVVILGSGCGGGVSAKNLTEAGLKVIVAEKGFYWAPKYLPLPEADAGIQLFENGGVEASDDSSISVVSANVWGGGGTVNWSASFQTQQYVRQEWADGGLPFFTSSQFQKSLDRVCDRMGVSTDHIHHNKNNSVLIHGAKKLGYNARDVPQNTGGKQHYCGHCMLGCGSAEKQGPVVSFLPDAARAGAQFIEGFKAEKVLFDTVNSKKVAIGVQGLWHSRDSEGGVTSKGSITRTVIIKAKRVVVSCGSLQSPLLLLRSDLTNPQIGRNLHLHPATHMFAVFDERMNPWEGGILTTVIDDLEDLDGHGHGAKIEASTMNPGNSLTLIPWTSGLDFKNYASNFKNMACGFSLCRDRDTGRVWADSEGRCRIAYTPSPFDRRSNLEGLLALAKIFYVAGAKEIISSVGGLPSFIRQENDSTSSDGPSINDPEFQDWLAQMRKKGMPSPAATFATAHQMGSCRMGSSERTSVVDPTGAVWGVENLYIADASVFPSASGVNPMVSNM